MITNNLGLIESALTFLIVIGFCVWQYISASRPSASERTKGDPPESAAARHSEREHPLDDR